MLCNSRPETPPAACQSTHPSTLLLLQRNGGREKEMSQTRNKKQASKLVQDVWLIFGSQMYQESISSSPCPVCQQTGPVNLPAITKAQST